VDFMNWGYLEAGKVAGGTSTPAPDVLKFGLYEHVLGHGADPTAAEKRAKILEVGCGHGGGLNGFRAKGYTALAGLDFTPSNIAFCKRKWGKKEGAPRFEVNNAMSFCPDPRDGCHGGQYDTIINVESSHCYPSFHGFLQQCHNALRRGGTFRMCDFRSRAGYDELLSDFDPERASPHPASAHWRVESSEIITKEVLRASASFETSYAPYFTKLWFAPPLVRVMRNFCNLPGSDIYHMFETGELVYFTLRLKRVG